MEVQTMTVLYEDGSEVRINVADFDQSKHRMPGEAAPTPDGSSPSTSDAGSPAHATSPRKSRK